MNQETLLKQIHEDIADIKKKMEHIETIMAEDFELASDVIEDIKSSRKRPKKEFISHEDMGKEFN